MRRGELFIVSAPSGTGKSTLIRSVMEGVLAEFGGVEFSISHTTRPPRRGEVDGREYHFVDRSTFEEMISNDEFLEWAEYNENLYGTSLQAVLPPLERGRDVILDVEVQGARQVLEVYPEAHGIFILPPSYEVLETRIRTRGLDPAGSIAGRLAVSLSEIECYDRYRYVVVNDDLHRASVVLASIVLEKRHRLERQEEALARLLRDFRKARAEE